MTPPFSVNPDWGHGAHPHEDPSLAHQSLLTGARRLPGQHPSVRKATAPQPQSVFSAEKS